MVYFGYGTGTCDIANEDFRNRDTMWTQLGAGIEFFKVQQVNANLPKMKNHNELGNGRILAVPGEVYVIYLDGLTSKLDLTGVKGVFNIRWFNPLKAFELQKGSALTVEAGQVVELGNPPSQGTECVVLVSKE